MNRDKFTKLFLYYFCRQMGLNPNEIAPKNGITLEMENQGINKVGSYLKLFSI